MPTLRLRVRAEIAGQPRDGFPMDASIEVASKQGFNFDRLEDGSYAAIPAPRINTAALVALRAISGDIRLDFGQNSQADTSTRLPLKKGGLFLVFNANGPATGYRTKADAGDDASVKIVGAVAGTVAASS